ncbi:DNA-binding transcriptional regulator YhcF (GntR family) [Catenuloplanes nepalensis]|uniref:DNA-binding transcriptional regulator YhcF (GntR family) n=1 Tax=Catenuloplanes nepalensis TaxID=587533 RepID=A0ABT9MSX0_9ACTN|nr:GntR family transcriptional regulator [Catenuloplanes nepalensis]MDP9794531.1 DNA-binding transcriptional regulator YhcF (GntR family) [Catenuloplanes nepalensis]
MRIVISPDADEPPYAQIRDAVAAQARDGVLPAGTRLPAVRALADQLGLAVNTVARAYRELEQAGLVETRGRHGTVITARATGASTEALRLAGQYATATRALGVPPAQALDLARAALGL